MELQFQAIYFVFCGLFQSETGQVSETYEQSIIRDERETKAARHEETLDFKMRVQRNWFIFWFYSGCIPKFIANCDGF